MNVLSVCLDDAAEGAARVHLCHVDSGRKALAVMRLLQFDVLVTSVDVPDMNPWDLIDQAKTAQPWRKWALVSEHLSDEDERRARALGVVRIYPTTPSEEQLRELCISLRRRTSPRLGVTVVTNQLPSKAQEKPDDTVRR